MQGLPWLLLPLVAVSVLASAQQQQGVTLDKASYSGGNLTVELTTYPAIDTPGGTPLNGEIVLTWEKDEGGTWVVKAPRLCDGPNWIGLGSPATKWTLTLKINEPWTGRLKFHLKHQGAWKGNPVYLNISVKPKAARVEKGPVGNPVVVNEVVFVEGESISLYIRIRDPDTETLLTGESGNYILQIEGPDNGASCFTFDDGTFSREVTLAGGQAEFTLMAQPGATWAYLVGFDADRSPSNPNAIGGLRILLKGE